MKNFQYVAERFSNLLRDWIIQHMDKDEDLTDFEVRYQLTTLIDKFQVDLFFEIRDLLHTGKIDINRTNELDTVIDSFYMKVVHPQLICCV